MARISKEKLRVLTNDQIKRLLSNCGSIGWRTAPSPIREYLLNAKNEQDELNLIGRTIRLLEEIVVERYLNGKLFNEELFRAKGRYEAFSLVRENFPKYSRHKAFVLADKGLDTQLELIEKLEKKV